MKWWMLPLALALAQTQVVSHIYLNDIQIIIRRNNDVLAATVDGYVCYGTKEPEHVSCHRSIPRPSDDIIYNAPTAFSSWDY